MTPRILSFLSAAVLLMPSAGASADVPKQALLQRAQGCTQWVFGLTAPAARVRPLVPARWTFSRDPAGTAVLSYRMFRCRHLEVGRHSLRDVVWSELGVRLLPPDGAPQVHVDTHVDGHDYYMLFLHTPSAPLAGALARLGVPASVVRVMEYRETRAADTVSVRSREISPGHVYRLEMKTGPVTSPIRQNVGIRSWHESDGRIARGEETKPCINGTLVTSSLEAAPATLLADLADGTSAPDGSESWTSRTDPWLAFDSTTTFDIVEAPSADHVSEGLSVPCEPASS